MKALEEVAGILLGPGGQLLPIFTEVYILGSRENPQREETDRKGALDSLP